MDAVFRIIIIVASWAVLLSSVVIHNRLPLVSKSPKMNSVFKFVFSLTTLVIEVIFGVIYPVTADVNGDIGLKYGAIFFIAIIAFFMLFVSEYYSIKRYGSYIRASKYKDGKNNWTVIGIYPLAFSAAFVFLYTGVFNCR